MEQLITMTHKSGGTVTNDLGKQHILTYLSGSKPEVLSETLDDAAVIEDIVLKPFSHAVRTPIGDLILRVC